MNPHLINHLNSYRLDELRREARIQAAVSRSRQVSQARAAGTVIERIGALVLGHGRNSASAGHGPCTACGCVAGA